MLLTRAERGVFLSLYCAADEHGLFAADEMPLRLTLGLMEPEPVQPAILRCAEVGLVHLYRLGAVLYGVVDQYDADADPKTLADRPAPTLPMPPADICEKSRCSGAYSKKVGGKKTEMCEPPSAGAVTWMPEVHPMYLGGTSEVHPTVTGGTPEVQPMSARGTAEVAPTVTGGTPEVRARSLQDRTGQDMTGEGSAPASVPVHERSQEGAHAPKAEQPKPQMPEGAIALPAYENQPPKGMGGRVSARYDGLDRFAARWGSFEAYEAATMVPLPPIPKVLSEAEQMVKWERMKAQEARSRVEHPELYEDGDGDGEPLKSIGASEYLQAIQRGELP